MFIRGSSSVGNLLESERRRRAAEKAALETQRIKEAEKILNFYQKKLYGIVELIHRDFLSYPKTKEKGILLLVANLLRLRDFFIERQFEASELAINPKVLAPFIKCFQEKPLQLPDISALKYLLEACDALNNETTDSANGKILNDLKGKLQTANLIYSHLMGAVYKNKLATVPKFDKQAKEFIAIKEQLKIWVANKSFVSIAVDPDSPSDSKTVSSRSDSSVSSGAFSPANVRISPRTDSKQEEGSPVSVKEKQTPQTTTELDSFVTEKARLFAFQLIKEYGKLHDIENVYPEYEARHKKYLDEKQPKPKTILEGNKDKKLLGQIKLFNSMAVLEKNEKKRLLNLKACFNLFAKRVKERRAEKLATAVKELSKVGF